MIKEDEINKLDEEYNALYLENSNLRKKGEEMALIDVLLLNIKPKLKMVKISLDEYDYESAKSALEHVKDEIENIKNEALPINIVKAVGDANDALFKRDIEKAKEKYVIIKKFYDNCKDELLKQIIYEACIDLHKNLTEKK